MKFDDFDDNDTRWLCILIYLNIYVCVLLHNDLIKGHVDLVMLRSTTGPYGRLMLEVAYRKILLSLHRGCMGDDSSGRVVGVPA